MLSPVFVGFGANPTGGLFGNKTGTGAIGAGLGAGFGAGMCIV